MISPALKERYMFGLEAAIEVDASWDGSKSWIAWTWVGIRAGEVGVGGAGSKADEFEMEERVDLEVSAW